MPRKSKKVDKPILESAEVEAEAQSEAALAAVAQDTGGQLVDETQLDAVAAEAETDTTPVVPAELAAMHADTPVTRLASGDTKRTKKVASEPAPARPSKSAPKGKPKQRSLRYQRSATAVDTSKSYKLSQALELAKQGSYSQFDGTISLHVRLAPNKKKETESIRGLIQLPHGTGKTVNAAILDEALIAKIGKDSKTEFSILIATPALMPKVAKIAKILGPQGKMPSPKAGTVSDHPEDVLTALASGRVEYRADKAGIIHQPIGKVSWATQQLADNAQALLGALANQQLLSVTVSATMGPGVRVDLQTRQ